MTELKPGERVVYRYAHRQYPATVLSVGEAPVRAPGSLEAHRQGAVEIRVYDSFVDWTGWVHPQTLLTGPEAVAALVAYKMGVWDYGASE